MKRQQDPETIAAQLDAVVSGGKLPAHYRDWGRRLLDHLRRPVRIVVTGLPGSGKSSLINMMLSRQTIGNSDGIPVLDIAHGPVERIIFELENGKTRECEGLLADVAVPAHVIRARQELPDPDLRQQSYRELDLSKTPEISKRILAAALRDADIVLWCTNSFGENEQLLWSAVPDELKDRSFLVITRADRQMMWGVLSETIAKLEPVVSEEFLGLYPVATLQALSALTAQEKPDKPLWQSSGGESLCADLAEQVNSGRAADIDQALAILSQYADAATDADAAATAAAPEPVVGTVAGSARAAQVAATPEATAPRAAKAEAVLENAVKVLTSSGRDLLREIDGDTGVDTERVLERCAETIGTLSSHLQDTLADDPDMNRARDTVREAEEMLMLFQLERGEDATLDAVTLLLQMRKELPMRVPA